MIDTRWHYCKDEMPDDDKYYSISVFEQYHDVIGCGENCKRTIDVAKYDEENNEWIPDNTEKENYRGEDVYAWRYRDDEPAPLPGGKNSEKR